jgi:hypothetical protein
MCLFGDASRRAAAGDDVPAISIARAATAPKEAFSYPKDGTVDVSTNPSDDPENNRLSNWSIMHAVLPAEFMQTQKKESDRREHRTPVRVRKFYGPTTIEDDDPLLELGDVLDGLGVTDPGNRARTIQSFIVVNLTTMKIQAPEMNLSRLHRTTTCIRLSQLRRVIVNVNTPFGKVFLDVISANGLRMHAGDRLVVEDAAKHRAAMQHLMATAPTNLQCLFGAAAERANAAKGKTAVIDTTLAVAELEDDDVRIEETDPEDVPRQAAGDDTCIFRDVGGAVIRQRRADRYLDATAMCNAGGKRWAHYKENSGSTKFLNRLKSNIGIPMLDLIQSQQGGDHSGTWIHPQVAYHLAQWISPTFAVAVSGWLNELATTGRVEIADDHLLRDPVSLASPAAHAPPAAGSAAAGSSGATPAGAPTTSIWLSTTRSRPWRMAAQDSWTTRTAYAHGLFMEKLHEGLRVHCEKADTDVAANAAEDVAAHASKVDKAIQARPCGRTCRCVWGFYTFVHTARVIIMVISASSNATCWSTGTFLMSWI